MRRSGARNDRFWFPRVVVNQSEESFLEIHEPYLDIIAPDQFKLRYPGKTQHLGLAIPLMQVIRPSTGEKYKGVLCWATHWDQAPGTLRVIMGAKTAVTKVTPR